MARFVALIIFAAWLLAEPQSTPADEIKIKAVNGKAPADNLTVVGSGSGIVVGPGLVLTNRHVVQDGDEPYAGFRIRVGPRYTKAYDARALYICETHDLALLKMDVSITTELKILDGLAPLGTSVTAYGFPLGDQFGIGLTLTGGQVTRHPVDDAGQGEDSDIRRSLWHDAVTAGGSSGGPLVSRNGVLVGIHYASLKVAKGQALAVPSSIVASFLRKAGAERQPNFVGMDELLSASAVDDPKSAVVYVEILGERDIQPATPGAGGFAKFGPTIISEVKAYLPIASNDALTKMEKGELSPAFKITPADEVEPMTIARIAGRMTVIQILADGMLVRMGTVKFKILFPNGGGAELRAKLGDDVITGVPEDGVFVVGKAIEYTTVGGDTSFYIPLLSVNAVVDRNRVTQLLHEERARRAEVEAEDAQRRAKLAASVAAKKKQAEVNDAKRRLRRTFSDASGAHHIDAVAVRIDGRGLEPRLELVRMTDLSTLSVSLAKLSAADNKWVFENAKYIRTHGPLLIDYFEDRKANEAKAAPN